MKVMKFGGTSVGSGNSILSFIQIVEAVEEPVIVVVSALGGITESILRRWLPMGIPHTRKNTVKL